MGMHSAEAVASEHACGRQAATAHRRAAGAVQQRQRQIIGTTRRLCSALLPTCSSSRRSAAASSLRSASAVCGEYHWRVRKPAAGAAQNNQYSNQAKLRNLKTAKQHER